MAIGISPRLTTISESTGSIAVPILKPAIKIIAPGDYPAWDRYVLTYEQSGPYLTTAWKYAVENAYGHTTFYLAAYHNHDIEGVLPLVLIRPPMRKGILVSLPFCDYGGILTKDHGVFEALLHHAISLANEMNVGLEIRSPESWSSNEQQPGFAEVTNKCRMVLELPSSETLLWRSFKSKLRSQVKKAEKNGLVVRVGQMGLLDDFYRVFSRNMRDLGSPVHSYKWLKTIMSAYGKSALICIVYKDAFSVGAGLVLTHKQTVTIPWASTHKEFNRLSPNMLLYWTLLKYAVDHGYRIFDFGRSNRGEGTYAFKKQWGAWPVPLSWYRYGSHAYEKGGIKITSDKNGLRSSAEKIWQRIPLSVANAVGPQLRKYIDK